MNSPDSTPEGLRGRVYAAADAALKRGGSVGPLELLMQIGFLHPVHFEAWRKGHEQYPTLEEWIQVGPEKFEKTFRYFAEWVKERGMHPIEAPYTRQSVKGLQALQVTQTRDPDRERFYCRRYAPANLSEAKS